ALAAEAPGADPASVEARRELAKMLEKRIPPRGQVRAAAEEEAGRLTRWLAAGESKGPARRGLPAPLRGVAGGKGTARSWDGATQLYLGIAAVNNGLADLGQRSPARNAAILQLRDRLEKSFPAGPAGQRDLLYDSPSNYRPDAVRQGLDAI